MSNYSTRRMTRDDLYRLVRNTPEANLWGYVDAQKVDFLLQQDSWTGLANDDLIACGGIIQVWPGLVEAWISVTPLAAQHNAFVYRTTRLFLNDRIERYTIRRVQAAIREDFTTAHRFAAHLGFSLDAPLRKYGPNGETYCLVSRVM